MANKEETVKSESIGQVEMNRCILNEVFFMLKLSENWLSVNAISANNGLQE